MPSLAAVPRYRLGEYAYQALWWGVALVPLVVAIVRILTAPTEMTFFLFAVIGLPAIIAGQVIAGLLAWTYRRRQWRHWLGPAGAALSFAYYGAWLLLALTLPESSPGRTHPSLVMRWFGRGFAEGSASILLWLIPILFLAMLAAIVVEGRRAVRRWGASP